jgi:hypothetical protein
LAPVSAMTWLIVAHTLVRPHIVVKLADIVARQKEVRICMNTSEAMYASAACKCFRWGPYMGLIQGETIHDASGTSVHRKTLIIFVRKIITPNVFE